MVRASRVAAIASSVILTVAMPAKTFFEKRTVASLDQAAFDEAQQRDETATRALSSVPIKARNTRKILRASRLMDLLDFYWTVLIC